MASAAPRTSSAIRRRDETIVGLLEKIQRVRELEPCESILMERTVRRLTPKRTIWRWSHADDQQLMPIIKRIRTQGPRPFRRNDEIRDLAKKLGRTEWAVIRRMERLRKRECSKARKERKG